MIIKDFECRNGHVFESIVDSGKNVTKCSCGKRAERIFLKPHLCQGLESFNPHYDLQLGEYFPTAEHKKKFLKDKGWEQLSGPLSPRKSSVDREICTETQFRTSGHIL